MRRAVLLFNPVAGKASQRPRLVATVAEALRAQGLEVEVEATLAGGSAGDQAKAACERGVDIVFACGGDGTIHEALQGMVHQPMTALGVIPLGSANALARHLKLSLDPVEAALQQLSYIPRHVPVGHIRFQTLRGEGSRFFIVMAGAGPDGMLVYKMRAGGKQSPGRAMYYLRAAQLFLTGKFATFEVSAKFASGEEHSLRAISAMAVRVGDLGGLFSPLVRGGDIGDPHILLSLAKSPAWLSLSAWFAMSWTRLQRWNGLVEECNVAGFSCGAGEGVPVQVQADGEWLGQTPMFVELRPNALRLLMPPEML